MGIKAYKGFNHDMTCRDFKYEEGKTYKTDAAKVCAFGFHACIMPADVFRYYGFDDSRFDSVFYEVELDGQIDYPLNREDFDSKAAATEITISNRLGIYSVLLRQLDFVHEKWVHLEPGYLYSNMHMRKVLTGDDKINVATGSYRSIVATCNDNSSALVAGEASISAVNANHSIALAVDGGISAASGENNISIASYRNSIAAGVGRYSKTMSTGAYGISANTSEFGKSRSLGERGVSVVTQSHSEAITTGEKGIAVANYYRNCYAASTGKNGIAINASNEGTAETIGSDSLAISAADDSVAIASGKDSVVIVKGFHAKGIGTLGSHIIFIYYDDNGNVKTRTIHITGKKYKPGVAYFINADYKVEKWVDNLWGISE